MQQEDILHPPHFFTRIMKSFFPTWILCLITLLSCDDKILESTGETPSPFPTEPGRRTVLIYCAAQNSLGHTNYYGVSNWTKDSTELAAGKHFISDNDRLLVFVDDAYHPRMYRFSANCDPQLVFQWGTDANSANPATLQDVLTRIKERFPATEYGLTMWSHADGWIPSSNTNYGMAPLSFGIDVGTNGDMYHDKVANGQTIGAQMNIADMARAIQQSGVHFKYIFFDACLMQCVESSYELREVTDYIVASPISIAGNGAYYTHMLERGLFANNPCDIARTYYEDVTSDELYNEYGGFGIVISALKTDELQHLAETVKEALQDVDFNHLDLLSAHAYYVYHENYFYRPHYYDMRSALRQLLTAEKFAPVDNALNRALPFYAASQRYWVAPSYILREQYHNINSAECCGMSMFFPQQVYTDNASRCIYGNHNETYATTAWAKAIGQGGE